jgi:hypothetical protein
MCKYLFVYSPRRSKLCDYGYETCLPGASVRG